MRPALTSSCFLRLASASFLASSPISSFTSRICRCSRLFCSFSRVSLVLRWSRSSVSFSRFSFSRATRFWRGRGGIPDQLGTPRSTRQEYSSSKSVGTLLETWMINEDTTARITFRSDFRFRSGNANWSPAIGAGAPTEAGKSGLIRIIHVFGAPGAAFQSINRLRGGLRTFPTRPQIKGKGTGGGGPSPAEHCGKLRENPFVPWRSR